jgi:putative aldouronate transport system permease protein
MLPFSWLVQTNYYVSIGGGMSSRPYSKPSASLPKPTGRSLSSRIFYYRHLYLMFIPCIIFLLLLNYLPMFGVVIAFKRIDYALGLFKSPWVGFRNFEFLFATKQSWIAIRNTLLYNCSFIITGPVVSVIIAVLLNELTNKRVGRVYQTLIILPNFVSYVVVSYLLYAFLATRYGFINTAILAPMGKEGIRWYLEAKYWPAILFLVNGWKSWGFGTVIYLATMSGFDQELYEAATIDGATRWIQFWRITLPLLLPIIMLLFILSLSRIFYSDFGLFYQVPRGAGTILSTTDTLDTYVYRSLVQLGDIGMSSAAAFLQSVVGFTTILSANLVMRRIKPEWSVF